MHWQVKRVGIKDELDKAEGLQELLTEGWEPFAVAPAIHFLPPLALTGTQVINTHWIYLRKESY